MGVSVPRRACRDSSCSPTASCRRQPDASRLSCAREFENADITASPGDFKSGMDKLALIIRIQGIVMLVGALLFGLALLFGIVAALRAMLSA